MNVLDEKFAEFQTLETEDKVECFNVNGRPFDMIMSQQLNREIIDDGLPAGFVPRLTNEHICRHEDLPLAP